MAKRYNTIRLGMVLGLLAPLPGVVIVYLVGFHHMSLGAYFGLLVAGNKLSSVISLSVIPNLLLFFIFIWLNYLYSARGVLASTLLYALIVIVTKFMI